MINIFNRVNVFEIHSGTEEAKLLDNINDIWHLSVSHIRCFHQPSPAKAIKTEFYFLTREHRAWDLTPGICLSLMSGAIPARPGHLPL